MATTKTQGIVLSTFNYRDNDQIVTIFSSKFGKLAFLALGVNRLTSKNKYSLLTFNLSEFEIFKSRQSFNLSKLKTGVLLTDHLAISRVYTNYLYAQAISNLINQGQEFGTKNFKLFQNFQFLLAALKTNNQPFTHFVSFLFFNLSSFGGTWQLSHCVRCAKKYHTYRLFSFLDFGLVCANCQLDDEVRQDGEWIHFLQKLNQQKKLNAEEFIPLNYLIVLGKTLINYYQDHLGLDNLSFHQLLQQNYFQTDAFNQYTHSVLTK